MHACMPKSVDEVTTAVLLESYPTLLAFRLHSMYFVHFVSTPIPSYQCASRKRASKFDWSFVS